MLLPSSAQLLVPRIMHAGIGNTRSTGGPKPVPPPPGEASKGQQALEHERCAGVLEA